MNSKVTYLIVAIVAIIVGFLSAQAWRSQRTPAPAAVATKAPVLTLPEFSLKNRDGVLQSIHSWPGKSLVINFWATWCAPCRREIPLLVALQKQYVDHGFQVVGIAVDFREDVLKYAAAMKMDYPILIGEQDGLAAVDAFGIEAVGFPYTVFTDARGDIVTTHIGELQRQQAELIFTTVQRINTGEIALNAARSQLIATLSKLKVAVASENQAEN